ncbi:MAG TPA: hypothetical protein VMG41_13915 [Gemmatimonadales bacterium]|nr:hypothetical protein [Gemmatimonadales bacterium]
MTICELLIDRMPLVAHGRDAWTTEELAHLASCPECAPAWRLVQAASHLGAAAARDLDTGRTGDRVVARLSVLRRRARWRAVGWAGLAAAAAVALVVSVSLRERSGHTVATAEPPFHLPIAELEGLSAPQLETVLEGLDAPLGASSTPDTPALGDLGNAQLEQVLRSLEG